MSNEGQKHKVVVMADIGEHARGLLSAKKELDIVAWPEQTPCKRSWLLEQLPGASAVIVLLGEKVDAELLDAAGPSLKVVSTGSVGCDHIDVAEVQKRGIRIGYTPDVLTDAVADLTVLLVLLAGRNGGSSISLVQDGGWPQHAWTPFGFTGPQLSPTPFNKSRTVGFLGFGRIAQATLTRLAPFGITRAFFTSSPRSKPDPQFEVSTAARLRLAELKRVDLDELARESDVVIVLAPGGTETRHIVDEAFLRKMKKEAVLVNASRGTLVDSDALAKALREGWIWGAALDVVEGEPNVGADHPLVKEPRCTILPHIGSATIETRKAMMGLAAENVIEGLLGEKMPAELV